VFERKERGGGGARKKGKKREAFCLFRKRKKKGLKKKFLGCTGLERGGGVGEKTTKKNCQRRTKVQTGISLTKNAPVSIRKKGEYTVGIKIMVGKQKKIQPFPIYTGGGGKVRGGKKGQPRS